MYRYFLIHQIFAMVIAVAAVASMATARAQGTGEVAGTITDSLGAPIVGATVRVEGSDRMGITHGNGTYVMFLVPEGEQTLMITATGFQARCETAYVVAGATARMDVSLAPKRPAPPPPPAAPKVADAERQPIEKILTADCVVGTIRDEDGKPIPGAAIRLEGTTLRTKSRVDGSYIIQGAAPGIYEVAVANVGYRPLKLHIVVSGTQATRLDIEMEPKAIESGSILMCPNVNFIRRDETGKVQRIRFDTY